MKKHVKFTENNSDKSSLYHTTSFLPFRSTRPNHVKADKTAPRFGLKMQRAEQNRDLQTIYIPKTMTEAPFLQHSCLTPGQKRFLYSVSEAYSKDHMRQLICQHYMNVLHRCIRTDLSPHVKPQLSTTLALEVEPTTHSLTTTIFGTKERVKRLLPTEKDKKTTFPKIINRPRVSSRFPKTNKVQTRRKTTITKHSSSRESPEWDIDLHWETTDVDSYLTGRISGLSFNDSEDENEDFNF